MVDLDSTTPVSWDFQEGVEVAPGRTVLKRFTSLSELYETYLVWDERRFSIMVAKLVMPQMVNSGSARQGIKREWTALTRLQHPIVVRAFELVSAGPHPHILLEHLEGFTLHSLVRRQGPLPLEQVLPLALHLASALHYFAAEGFIHLDVKPENIIMSAPPKLIDLSLVHSVQQAAKITYLVGTDAFMAPEQCLSGEGPPITPAADIFGLAATVHFACTGKVPFPRPPREERYTLADRFPQIEDDPMPLPKSVPSPLREVLAQALSRDPQERPSAAEFAGSLQPLVAQLPHRFVMTKSGWQAR
jgi:serine/threonine protein kinase